MPAPRITSKSPWHIVLILDDSNSMSGDRSQKLNDALDNMIEEMRIMSQGTKPYFRISVVSFGSSAKVLAEYQSESAIQKSSITSFKGDSNLTYVASALQEAIGILKRNPGAATDFEPFVFLLTDGEASDKEEALKAANELKQLEVASGRPQLVTLALGAENEMPFLKSLASHPELAKLFSKADDLVSFFPQIGTVVSGEVGTAAVVNAIIDL
jgi:uncharacterized protein YegL